MKRSPALLFIFVTLALDILGIGIVVPVLPKLVESMQGLGTGEAAKIYGWLVALYAGMQFLFAPLFGCLSDRYGRRPVILLALLGAGLDYFLLAWAPTLLWFFIGRVIAGITGANFAAATAYIADISPPEKRAANFALVGAAFGAGFVIGPALGGFLGAEFGLRAPFIAAGILTLLNCLYGFFVLPESLTEKNRRPLTWLRALPISSLLILRRNSLVFGLACAYFLINLAHQVYHSIWVLYTDHRFDWDVKQVAYSLSFVGVMAVIVQGFIGRVIIPKFGEKRTAIFALSINVLDYIAYGLVPQGWMIYLIIFFGSLGGLAGPTLQGLVSRSVGDHEQGSVQGALTSVASLAGAIGPVLLTGTFAYFISADAPIQLPGAAFFAAAVLTILAIGIAVALFRKVPPKEETEAKAEPHPQAS